jgi:hypothetical protein
MIDDYQKEKHAKAEKLANEIRAFYPDMVEIFDGDNGRADYRVRLHQTQKMSVITKKKLDAKIAECLQEEDLFNELETKALSAKEAFLESLKGLDVKFHYRVLDEQKEITGGSIEKNGIEFDFQFHDDGYVSKKIFINYSVNSTVDSFLRLSENKYQPETNEDMQDYLK